MRHAVGVRGLWMVMLVTGCGLTLDLEPDDEDDAAVVGEDAGRGPTDLGKPEDATTRDANRPEDDAFSPAPDAEVCAPSVELCNGADEDCDGFVDEDYDLSTDLRHCGACGTVCEGRGGTPRCEAGRCRIECDPGRADCDDSLDNGCEADLSDPSTCGGCDVMCDPAAPNCVSSGTAYTCAPTCLPPRTACGGSCVDPDTSDAHCGSCGNACFSDPHGRVECRAGACVVDSCGDWHYDCNGDASDGCETSLQTNTDCGGCGVACGAGRTCISGACLTMSP